VESDAGLFEQPGAGVYRDLVRVFAGKGRNWARWVYLLTQIIAAGYLWAASLGYGYPELFSIAGNPNARSCALVMQKLPDLLVLLLFVPASSRRFFRLQ
jgi:hypothetical protein